MGLGNGKLQEGSPLISPQLSGVVCNKKVLLLEEN